MQLAGLILEDERPVREALARDLGHVGDHVRIEVAEDVPDAWTVIDELDRDGDQATGAASSTSVLICATWWIISP